MNILWLFDTCGNIVGPAIIVAGLWAAAPCLLASRRSSTFRARKVAQAAAVSPVIVGICGAVFGLIVYWVAGVPDAPWLALGKVCLAGVVVAVLPLVWALMLLRTGPSPPTAVSGE